MYMKGRLRTSGAAMIVFEAYQPRFVLIKCLE
jgi:hypothetical protein